jgi:hypothetical protein
LHTVCTKKFLPIRAGTAGLDSNPYWNCLGREVLYRFCGFKERKKLTLEEFVDTFYKPDKGDFIYIRSLF